MNTIIICIMCCCRWMHITCYSIKLNNNNNNKLLQTSRGRPNGIQDYIRKGENESSPVNGFVTV